MIAAEMLAPLTASAVQAGTPILYASLGEMLTERSGVLNLGVEGMMIVGALGAFAASHAGLPPLAAWMVGGMLAACLGLCHAVTCIFFLGNQIVSGLALTILGVGLVEYIGVRFIGRSAPGFDPLALPWLSDLPFLGRALFQQDLLVYFVYLLPFAYWLLWKRTAFGQALTATGENPEAARAAGINPRRVRTKAVLIGGFLAGLGGGYLSLAYTHLWTNGLTSGRGWIAVALVIFAGWRPGLAVIGACLFGGVTAFQLRMQAQGSDIPSSILLMLPYVATIIALAVSAQRDKLRGGGRGGAPAALGVNIDPDE